LHRRAGPLEQFHRDLLVDFVIFGEEDPGATQPAFKFADDCFSSKRAIAGLGEDSSRAYP
jgi:hypothetical protein